MLRILVIAIGQDNTEKMILGWDAFAGSIDAIMFCSLEIIVNKSIVIKYEWSGRGKIVQCFETDTTII